MIESYFLRSVRVWLFLHEIIVDHWCMLKALHDAMLNFNFWTCLRFSGKSRWRSWWSSSSTLMFMRFPVLLRNCYDFATKVWISYEMLGALGFNAMRHCFVWGANFEIEHGSNPGDGNIQMLLIFSHFPPYIPCYALHVFLNFSHL
jgi:hypothetical protein